MNKASSCFRYRNLEIVRLFDVSPFFVASQRRMGCFEWKIFLHRKSAYRTVAAIQIQYCKRVNEIKT